LGPVSAVLLCVFAGLTASRAVDWADPIRLAIVTAKDHPDSPRSLYDAGRAVVLSAEAAGKLDDSVREEARAYFARAMTLNKTYLYPATSFILAAYHHKQVPRSLVDDLAFRLRHMPLFQVTPFLMLLKAAGDGQFSMAPTDVERAVDAALDNPGASRGARALILNDYGRYSFVVEHDAQGAVSLTLAAAEMAPGNPFFQVNLTRLALALGQPNIAEVHLAKAKEWDITAIYRKDVQELARQIKEQKAEGKKKPPALGLQTKGNSKPSGKLAGSVP